MKKYCKSQNLFILIIFLLIICINKSYGQTCNISTPANPGSLTGTNYTVININPSNGLVSWFTGGTLGGANINISANSTLIIKTGSFLTLTGATSIPAGSKIYIESGASLTIPGTLTILGTIINLGTLTITGSNYLQINGGSIYNDGTIVASSSYLHLTNAAGFIFSNGGSASFTYVYWQITTGTNSICLRPGSIFNLISFPNAYPLTGTGTLPTNGLFKYNNSTDISANTPCTAANPARVNYYQPNSGANNGSVVFGPTGQFSNHASITVVGNNPAPTGSEFGVSTRVTSGTGYSDATPNSFNLVTQSPVPAVTGNYLQYCLNSTVPLSVMASGASLLWYTSATGGVGATTAPTVVTSFAGLQTFWVSQNVTGSCVGPRNPININIVSTAATALTASSNSPVCAGGSLTLSATATSITSWNWTGPNNYTSTTQNPTVSASATVAMSGTYTIVDLQTTGTCNNSATTTVVVNSSTPSQPAAFTTSTAAVCKGQTNVTYTVPAVVGATSYNWTYSGSGATISGTTNSVSINYSWLATAGTLSVTATNSCGTSVARTMAITINTGISIVPTSGLIAYYKLDGNANDETLINPGTFQNGPTPSTNRFGISNRGYSFNGSSQFMTTTVAYNNPSDFSLCVWFNTTTTVGGRIIGFGDSQTGNSGNRDRFVWMDNNGKLNFAVNPGSVGYTISSSIAYNDGNWHQVIATCSSTNGINLYMDGALVNSNASALGGQNYTGYWRVNYDQTSWSPAPTSNYFNALMDDIFIYNRAITAAEVTTLSNPDGASNNGPVCNNGTLNLTGTTVGGAIYGWTGPSSFSAATRSANVTTMNAAKVGTYTLTETEGTCTSTAWTIGSINYNLGPAISQVPSAGLLSRYRLNNNAYDDKNINPGILQGTPDPATDRFGIDSNAYSFNGSSQYISTSLGYTNPSDLSISVWFNTTTNTGGRLVGFGNTITGLSGNYDRHLYMNNAGQIFFGVNPATGIRTINSSSSYNDGAWHHAVATLSSTNGIKLYIDGISVATDAVPLGGQNYTGYWRIGFDRVNGWSNAPTSNYFAGSLDDVLIYNTELTAAQVTTLYSSPDGAGQNGPVCVGSTLAFSAPTVASTTYAWTGPNSFSSSAQNPTVTFQSSTSGTYTLVAKAAVSGCTSTAYAVTKYNTTTPGTWTGYTDNNWATPSNWCGGSVPSSTTDVLIPSVPTLPTNSGAALARNLTINNPATLTNTANGTISIFGNLINNGTFTNGGNYLSINGVTFTGSTAQTISGTSSNTVFNNFTINNSLGVTLSSVATINGILTLTAGNFTTNNNLTQNLYTGAIAGAGGGSTTGNIKFTKIVWGDKYHYLSVPIGGMTAADWNDNVVIKFGANSNLYSYNEALLDTNRKVGWTALSSTGAAINSFKGYALFFPRWIYNTVIDVTGTYNHSASYSSGSLSNTKSTTPVFKPASDGWQLMGNPYPSNLDWDAASGWTKTGIDNAIYSWDARTNRYISYVTGAGTNGGTRYIGSMQGFFVKVNTSGGTGSLDVNNNARVTTVLKDVWRTTSDDKILRLKIANGLNEDETVIRFTDSASELFDSNYDAYKLLNDGTVPSLFSLSADADYSINSLPKTLITKTIPLQLNIMEDGEHNWNAELSSFDSDQIVLEDRLSDTTYNLSSNPTLTMTLTKGEQKGRFYLHYSQREIGVIEKDPVSSPTSGSIEIITAQQNILLLFTERNSGTANVSVFDAVGKKVYALENTLIPGNKKLEFNLPNAPTGVYIIKVQTSTSSKTQQVFIQK